MTVTLNWPWSNICNALQPIILNICAELFENPTRGSKDIEQTRNTVIQWLNLNYDLNLDPIFVKHTHCILTHHSWHLYRDIWNSTRKSKDITIADTKYSHTKVNLKYDLGKTYKLHNVSSYLTFDQSYMKIQPGVQTI